ncbi:MAG: DUF3450 family protein [Verrucomicrobiota bacterium]
MGALAQTVAEQHVELKTTIEQWMEVMEKTQQLEGRWANDQKVLQDTILGLEGMIQQTEKDIEEVQLRLDSADLDSKAKLEQQESYHRAREAFRDGLEPLEAEVAKVVPLLPQFYIGGEDGSAKLKSAIEKLREHRTAEPDEKAKLGLNGRMQPLVQILLDAERFNSRLWAVSHPLSVDGTDKQMNVLYFGLSSAFAVDEGGTVALKGTSSATGWSFEKLEGDRIAALTRDLFKSADGSGESQLVTLPLDVQ